MSTSVRRHSPTAQGVVLTLAPVLAVMGFVLVAPVLANIQAHFQAVPHSEFWVPLVMTAPAFCIAVLSPLAGVLSDRFGARRILLGALAIYAVFGIAPLFLESLFEIVLTRVGVGIAEACILTCTLSLVGGLFHGDERQKWIAYQAGVSPAASAVLLLAGGFIGSGGWRYPFAGYAFSMVIFFGVAVFVSEPPRAERRVLTGGPPIPWAHIGKVCSFGFFASLIFYLVPAELAFVMSQRGIQSPSVIGFVIALGTLTVPLGTLSTRRLTGFSCGRVLAAALLVMGGGLVVIALGTTLQVIALGVVIHQFGGGIMLPTAMTYALNGFTPELQGRGTGIWWSSYFIGQFLTPISVTLLVHGLGTLTLALLGFAVACVVFCVPVSYLMQASPSGRLKAA